MLKNKIIFKRIRNICILVMAVAILVGAYTYVRRSRAENIIQIELEVSDKSETLEAQKIIVDATENQDGNYILDLPTAVNGNMVTKYYMADGSEVDMNDENANKTLTLTESDITNQPMQLQTDYDKKEVTTEDGQTITLYNKELMDVKDTEEDANAENTEGADNEAQANETQTNETTENGETSEVTGEEGATEETANETTTDEATQEPELDDTVIVTGYMPLETQVDIEEMDVSTLPEIQLANENQTIQKAYEVSVYQTQRRTFDAEGNMITEEIVKPESNIDNGTNNEAEENIIDNTTEENATNSTTDLMAIENINSENAKENENENVTSVTEATTPDNTTITTIILNDGTRIEEEKIEYDPSIYNEQLTIKTKNTEANTIATIYELQDDNQVISLESTNEEDYVDTTIEKDNQVARLALATEPNLQNEVAPNSLDSDSGIATMALTDGNMLKSTTNERDSTSGFLGNTSIQRQNIDNVTFVDSIESNKRSYDVTNNTGNGHSNSTTTWKDLSGNYDAQIHGATWTNDYLSLDGVDDWVGLGNIDFTNQVTLDITIVAKEIQSGRKSLISNLNSQGVTLMLEEGIPSFMFYIEGKGLVTISSNKTVTVGEKTRITGTYDGTTASLYVNGVLVKQTTEQDAILVAEDNTIMVIGGNPAGSGVQYANTNINVYSAKVYDKAMSMTGENTLWDVSEEQNGSIMAWYTTNSNGSYKVYIGSTGTIYANPNSSYLFSYIGYGSNCTSAETITNIELLNTSTATDMNSMFTYTGHHSMTSLDLGDNFDTSNVTNMAAMFSQCGFNKMTRLDLGSKFNTSKVRDMSYMFGNTGQQKLSNFSLGNNFDTSNVTNMQGMFQYFGSKISSLDLGSKFDTSNVTNMYRMFKYCGYDGLTTFDIGDNFNTRKVTNMNEMFAYFGREKLTNLNLGDYFYTTNVTDMTAMFDSCAYVSMTSLELGPAFTRIANTNTNMFNSTGKEELENVIFCRSEIYSSLHAFKLNSSSSSRITYDRGYVVTTPDGYRETTAPTWDTNIVSQKVNLSEQTLQIELRGTDNAVLKDAASVLSSSNVTVRIGFVPVLSSNLVFGTPTYSSDGKTKTFPITIRNYSNSSGSSITVRISAGALVDVAGNTSLSKTYSFNGPVTAPGTLRSASSETLTTSGFLGNTSIQRQYIENITFVSSTSGMSSNAWDVSEEQNGSIMAWYTANPNGSYKVYIGSNFTIYANPDSSYLFSYIGYSTNCTVTQTITNIDLLNTSKVTNMRRMFNYTGYETMTSLDLGNNFDTSKVTDMSYMFNQTGHNAMTSLDLGNNFDTSKVTDMSYMFNQTGYNAMTSLDLGNNFDTSKVTDMSYMFAGVGHDSMTSLDLGDKFDTSNVTNMIYMFNQTGYNAMTSLDLGNNFDTRNVTDMSSMFYKTGYEAMTSLNLGDKFDTSSVTDMGSMFAGVGHDSMTSLDLGDKFDTSNVTNMNLIFTDVLADIWDYSAIKTLDLGPAFTHIIESSGISNFRDLSNTTVIYVPESIYQDRTHFKENANSTTISSVSGTINPKYRTEWIKQSVQVSTSSKNVQISLRGTTNTEVSGSEYASNVTSSLTASNIKIFMDDTEVTSYITKSLGSATRTYNSSTGAYDVLHTLTLSNFEEAYIRTGKDYKEWSGNIRIEIPQGTLTDTYGNKNMELASDGSRDDNNIEDATTDRNTTNTLFADFIKPDFIYNFSSTDIDREAKTLTVDFSVTDKYFNSSTISSNASNIVVRMADTNTVPENLTTSLRKIQDITETRNGSSVKVGEEYRLVISGFEQASVDNGKYKEYSGPVSIAFPSNMVMDKSGNGNNSKTITVGIDEPDGTGDEEIVDFIRPEIEEISSSIDLEAKTATVKFQVTDKYVIDSNPLETGDVQILVNGSPVTVNGGTGVLAALSRTNLTEQRVENGVTSTVQYGWEYNLEIRNLNTNVNQIKVRIPAGAITDTSGNGNEQTDFILLNTLRETSTETGSTSAFLGNTRIQRQNINNVTFMDYIPEAVYNDSTNTYVDSTAWDVSAVGDNSIIAWYESSTNGTVKVYIGSNGAIFGNVNSSYLFSYIGYSSNCTATETITNIELLNTSNVTTMKFMFYNTGYESMTSLDLGNNFDTSNVTDMYQMFWWTGAHSMTSLDLGDKFDTSNVKRMENTFAYTGLKAMTSIDLGDKFDTSNVTDMQGMFASTGRDSMTSLDLGDKFDTSNVTNMDSMFQSTGRDSMTSLDLGDKFDTSNVTNMVGMFQSTGRDSMTSLDLGDKFDTSNVTDMSGMFYQAGENSMTSLDLGDNFDTSNVTDMGSMFFNTGYRAMTSLDLGDKFDTSNVTDMSGMFYQAGENSMTSLDLGDKFDTSNVTNMGSMFACTGQNAMTSLDLGPAFTNIASTNTYMFDETGKAGEIIIQAPEAIYQNSTNFKLNTDSSTIINFTNGTINPKYRTEWIKETVQTDTTDANNPKLNITLRGTTNTEVAADEYISDVTSSLTTNDIKIFIDNTDVTNIVTKTLGTATQTTNTRTGANDVSQVLTLSNFIEATRQTGKLYKEWSGNIRVEIPQGTLVDTTYGNKNMGLADDGTREDSKIEDETKVEQNTPNGMFADYIKPEFTYEYSSTDINYDEKTLTVEFSVTDKYFNSTTGLTNANGITVRMLDTNVVPENITKTLTKVEDINETRNGEEVKIGETYRLVVSGFEQASIAEDGKYKEYSGPVSIAFPAGIVSDKSGNTNTAKTITVGIDEPDQTGDAEIVDVVSPIWEARNLNIDEANNKVTVDLYGTDKYYENNTLDINKIKVIIDGEEITSSTNAIKQLSASTELTETRDGANAQYGVMYTLTLSNFVETDGEFEASGRIYREYSGNTKIEIEANTLVDESGNANVLTTLDLGKIDTIHPEILKVSSNVDEENQKETIVFDVVDKDLATVGITTTDTSKIHVYVDNEEATTITKTITNVQDLTATIDGNSRVVGKRYTLELSNIVQPRTTTIDYDREYADWSGNISITIDEGTATDNSGNANEETTIEGDFVDFIKPEVIYQYAETDIDSDGKSYTMVFDIVDKYYTSGTLTLEDLAIRIDGEEPDWTEVNKALQVEDRMNMVNGESKVIGKRFTLTLSNLEQLQIKEGDNYLDYSGVVTVAIPADKIMDTTGHGNDATTLTSGISLPGGTGAEEVVDVVDPLVEKITSNVDVANKTATMTFKATDKYFENSTLTNENIQIVVNGSEDITGITKQLTSTPLNEQRVVNGASSTVQYGVQYTLNLTGIDTNVNQIKVRIPEGWITDASGNGNKETDLILLNTLRKENKISEGDEPFLGNTSIERQNIDNITFVDNIPEDVYDVSTNTLVDSTAWDVSAVGDNSILAWYEENDNGTIKVYIGSNDEMFGNVDSSYLFARIGLSENCTSTEPITNLEILNTSNVTNMSYTFWSTGYAAMTTFDLGKFDTSNVTDMSYMFQMTGSKVMTSLDLGDKFDTSKVTDMNNMFWSTGIESMTSLNLGENFDTSSVTNMNGMFNSAGSKALTSLDLGDKFDTSSVTDMSNMFDTTGHDFMTMLELGDKFDTSNVTNMSFMFYGTGFGAMTSLDLGDKFDTSKVTNMSYMFSTVGHDVMTSLDLGDKFDVSNVTNMSQMFQETGANAMTSLDLGPAFTRIATMHTEMFDGTGKDGEIVIQATEAIYQNATNFKLSTDSTTMLGFTRGTINPKYRTEWIKEGTTIDETEANNPKLNITLRGTTNTEVASDEYISNVTSSLTENDFTIYIDDIEITDIVTKTIGTATQTANTRTGAQDVLQVLTISNFEEATRQTGKLYKEWSGNIRVEVAQGTLSDTTGPADETGKTIPYGNKNMEVASADTQTGAETGAGAVTEIGARIDNIIQDATKVEQNTEDAMFADFIKPEFTYTYSSTDINYDEKTLTVEFSITDKYFNTSDVLNNQDNITVKMLEEDVVPENITKTLTKVEDITEMRDEQEVKIGETYRLVVSGFEQASIAEDGNYKEYSGPVSIVFPAGMSSDKSGNANDQKNITIGINEPDGTGNAEIVDVVDPIWEARNLNIDKENDRITVELYGTDKYYENNTLDVSKIKVIIDGEEVTSTENVTKGLSAPTELTETRDGVAVPYGVKYTLTLSNWKESDTVFQASEKEYREYSGNTEIQIEAGTLVDESGNENIQTTLNLGMIDIINPEVYQISSTKDDTAKTDTIVFEVVDKYFASAQISATDTSKLTVYVDNEEAIGVTTTITNEEDMTATVNGTSRVIGKRYTLVISNFEQPRTTIDYDREYSDWSGDVTVKIDAGTIVDESGNSNQNQE